MKAEILKTVTHKEVLDLLDSEIMAQETTKRVSGNFVVLFVGGRWEI